MNMTNITNDKKLRRLGFWIAVAMLIHTGFFQIFGSFSLTVEALLLMIFRNEVLSHVIGQTLYGIVYFLAFAIPTWIFCGKARRREEYRKGFYDGAPPLSIFFVAMAVIAMNFAVAFVNQSVLMDLFPDAWGESVAGAAKPHEIVMMVFTTAVVPAIAEEMLFRGAFLTNLLPFGRNTAILTSAILFGLMHNNPLQFLYTTLMGVMLGVVYVKTRSIYSCMIIHFLNNLISVIQTVTLSIPDESVATAWYLVIELAVLVLGGVSVLYFIRCYVRRPRPERTGCFGVIAEPHGDYAVYPVTKGKRISLLLSPAMIVYIVIACVMMVLILLSLLLASMLGGLFYV